MLRLRGVVKIYHIISIILSFLGLGTSSYIYYSNKKNVKMYCIIGKDCNKVIKSKYSELFGIKNELLGILYYLFIISNSIFRIIPTEILLIPVSLALLTSLILTFIQLFILKEFCEYCLFSNLINFLIFLVVVF